MSSPKPDGRVAFWPRNRRRQCIVVRYQPGGCTSWQIRCKLQPLVGRVVYVVINFDRDRFWIAALRTVHLFVSRYSFQYALTDSSPWCLSRSGPLLEARHVNSA